MWHPPRAAVAKTYCLIAVIMSFIAAAVWVLVGLSLSSIRFFTGASALFLVFGLVAVLIAVMVYLTTYDRIGIGDYVGAKGPCLVWGFLGLIFGFLIPGIFLMLAHSKLSEIAQPASPMPVTMSYAPPRVPPHTSTTPPPRTMGTSAPPGSLVCFGCGLFMPATATTCPRCGKRR